MTYFSSRSLHNCFMNNKMSLEQSLAKIKGKKWIKYPFLAVFIRLLQLTMLHGIKMN